MTAALEELTGVELEQVRFDRENALEDFGDALSFLAATSS